MAIDLLMDKTVKMSVDAAHMDINAIKFRVFRAMALCKLQQGDIHGYIRNLLVALSIGEKCFYIRQIPFIETLMDLAMAQISQGEEENALRSLERVVKSAAE